MNEYPTIALIDGNLQRFSSSGQVPGDAELLVDSREDLEEMTAKELMEKFPFRFPTEIKSKKDRVDAIEEQLGLMPISDDVKEEEIEPEPKSSGKRKYVRKNKPDYRILPPTKKSLDAISRMPPQARALVEILGKSKKDLLSEDELKALIHEHRSLLKTTCPPLAWR